MRPVVLVAVGILSVLLPSCGKDCAGRASCIPEIAATISVSASPGGGPVADAVVEVSGKINTVVQCFPQSTESSCTVYGADGTYVLEISAPGYQSAERTIKVRSRPGECGCVIVETQHLDIRLVRIG